MPAHKARGPIVRRPRSSQCLATPPRRERPDGHPDLQGTWDNPSVTPLERPKESAGQAYFTEEEIAEYRKHGIDRLRATAG
jgi:hypothetical protein